MSPLLPNLPPPRCTWLPDCSHRPTDRRRYGRPGKALAGAETPTPSYGIIVRKRPIIAIVAFPGVLLMVAYRAFHIPIEVGVKRAVEPGLGASPLVPIVPVPEVMPFACLPEWEFTRALK